MVKKSKTEQEKPGRFVRIVTAMILLIGPLPLIGYGVSRVVDAAVGLAAAREASAARETWMHINGEVAHSEIVEEKSLLGPGYRTEVEYVYVLNGGEYTGSRITFNDQPFRKRSEAEAVVEAFEAGESITVFYDPNQPENAALSLSAPGGTVATLVMGLVITLIFIVPYVVILSQGHLKTLFLGNDE
ncbi:MAG: DUF3592 domain-containing protein [Anaerolineae bacterium]|nr:DUF3592 domain-containing protein [Anaerolineae bacterium]